MSYTKVLFQNRLVSRLTTNLTSHKRHANSRFMNTTSNGGADAEGWTPLHVAASRGQFERVKQLIDAGADVNSKDIDCFTPLHTTIRFGHMECMKLLIQSGADVNSKLKNQETMLHAASILGYYQCLKVLINAGADVNSTTANGNTPLMFAAADYAALAKSGKFHKSSEICVEVLLHEGAKINMINIRNENAAQMHMYCQSLIKKDYNSRILQVLFAAGEMERCCKESDLLERLCKNSDFAEFSQRVETSSTER